MHRNRSFDGDLDLILRDKSPAKSSDITSPLYLNPVVDYQRATVDAASISKGNFSRVLVIYTGGTIGMKAVAGQVLYNHTTA